MIVSNEEKAEILLEALPYIQKYFGQTIVIKYGGNAMLSNEHKVSVMKDLVLLNQIGIKVVLVHGGGPEINEVLDKMNIKSQFINGLRQTDKPTMEVVQMVLAGKVNKNLVNIIENNGGNAIGLCGIDGHMIEAKQISSELGYVGEITKVNVKQVQAALDAGTIPVISTIGCDNAGNIYNINADTVAARIAGELKAKSMIVMTDTKGILRDKDDENTLISEINVSETAQLIKENVISGGMIPKSACCVEAIRRGVKRVFIIDGRAPHAILVEILSDKGIGTMFY